MPMGEPGEEMVFLLKLVEYHYTEASHRWIEIHPVQQGSAEF